MADIHAPLQAQQITPLTVDGFIADRQQFWSTFTVMVRVAAVAIAILLILMAIFLT